MSKSVIFYLSLLIVLPLIIGLIRIRKISVSYYPLIILLGIGLVNEVMGYYLFTNNALPNNIYFIIECLFFIWQFRKWGNILQKNIYYYLLLVLMIGIWTMENLVLWQIMVYSPVFQISYSLTLILLAVNQMNWLIVNDISNIYKNAIFIVCIAIIIFYSYKILMEIFYYYAPEKAIQHSIFSLEAYVNVLFNLLLAIAILCIPRKKDFILQLS